MKVTRKKVLIALVLLALFCASFQPVHAEEPVVRAVLFYSSNCPHCLEVINDVLPSLDKQYGRQLQVFGIDAGTEEGSRIYNAAIEAFNIPENRVGVPTLIVGDHVLVGSNEIPQQLPTIVEEGLASGGIDWPAIPGLQERMEEVEKERKEKDKGESEQIVNGKKEITLMDKFRADMPGNFISTVILVAMIATVFFVSATINNPNVLRNPPDYTWVIPLLSLFGIAVASYLSYVEITQTEAVCGPVGHCNTVQQSPYARVFGFLPVGVIGVLGYIAIIAAWGIMKIGSPPWADIAKIVLWIFTFIGTLFSIYLTFLEPFVIGASCSWCLSSAVTITVLFIIATQEVKTTSRYKNQTPSLENYA
ncbi:MAG: vitamin K epoxide reductase family protein [Anaerolineales bacterium]